MAIKVKLEKDGFIKDGFVGYSWTSLFFNVWVPASRLDFDGFIIFFIVYLIETILPAFIMITLIRTQNINNFSSVSILQFSFYIVNIIVGFLYNKYYTQKMLKNGWKLLENDDYCLIEAEDIEKNCFAKDGLSKKISATSKYIV